MSFVSEWDISRIADEVHSTSIRLAQEVFLERRRLILAAIKEETGKDYEAVIPTTRKGRPAKRQ